MSGCLTCTSSLIDFINLEYDEGLLLENAVSSRNLELVKFITNYQRDGVYPFNPFRSNAFVNALDDGSMDIVQFFLSQHERFAPPVEERHEFYDDILAYLELLDE